jgi:hypothetical protein
MTASAAPAGDIRPDDAVASSPATSPRSWLSPAILFLVAAALRLAVASLVPFPATEGSAYYVGVARNILDGDGFVTDALWSYATPPLAVPRPAFELWMPMSSFVAAAGMALLGPTFWAAQVASCLLGALLAPLTWGVARTAATAAGLDWRRAVAVAFASGLLVALASPFVLAAAVPDSYTPYVVASVAAAALVPGVVSSERVPFLRGLALGALLGLAYLARQEVVWLGLAVLVATWVGVRRRERARSDAGRGTLEYLRAVIVRLVPVVVGGLVVVLPWLVRNAAAFGTPFPGQALENALLRRNEDIYAFIERPTLAGYVEQGLATILGNPIAAGWDGLLNVLVLPAFPIGVAGIVAIVAMRRSPAFGMTGALGVLLLSGVLTFVSTIVLFPVATRWGTFLHASGPLLVALTVAAALGGDALLARISAIRAWPKPNVIVAPIALAALTIMLLGLQVLVVSRHARDLEDRYAALGSSLAAAASTRGEAIPTVVISDHPIWLTDALDRSSVALPDEGFASIGRLGRTFDTSWLVVVDERGRYPDALLGDEARACLADPPLALPRNGSVSAGEAAGDESGSATSGWLFIIEPGCGTAAEAGA